MSKNNTNGRNQFAMLTIDDLVLKIISFERLMPRLILNLFIQSSKPLTPI
ncbi:hypothetical protein [Enterococcus faecium]|nr:hypothetical protein [Enterococcus faecium]